jgi:hypothetical protein
VRFQQRTHASHIIPVVNVTLPLSFDGAASFAVAIEVTVAGAFTLAAIVQTFSFALLVSLAFPFAFAAVVRALSLSFAFTLRFAF